MLTINPKIFKAYDIRGIYGQDFDNSLAYLLGLAFVRLRQEDGDNSSNEKITIAVGCDMRLSSPDLKAELIRGLLDGGVNVVDLGTVSTPTLYFAVGKYNYHGGIIVSASHNPKEWNGFKLVRKKGVPVSGETGIERLRDIIINEKLIEAEVRGEKTNLLNVLEEEINFSIAQVDINKIGKLKVVADAANSMGALYLKKLFSQLPSCTLIPLNFDLDGSFPAHEADPLKEENLEQLQAAIISQGADLGIATDGDGDRMFFVDNQGKVMNPAVIRGLLAKLFLQEKPGAKIGYDVRPGKITADLISENGGIPVVTRVGHSLIKEQMIAENIYFAGESSGHFYLNSEMGCFEYPNIMILKLLTEFSQSGKTTSEYLNKYNKYFLSGEINREVADKEAVFKKIAETYSDASINWLDGVSVTYPNYWFNVRGSNTEEKVRLNLEAVTEDLMKSKTEEVLKIITS